MTEKKDTELAMPPARFMEDLRKAAKTQCAMSRLTGLSNQAAGHLMQGGPLYKQDLAMAMENFYGSVPSLRTQIGNVSAHSHGYHKLMSVLCTTAQFIEEYWGRLYVSPRARNYWVFPPRDTLSKLSACMEECRKLLKRLHDECPEYDKSVFRKAPGLLKELIEEDAHGSSGVHVSRVCKVRRRREVGGKGAEEGGASVQPSDA